MDFSKLAEALLSAIGGEDNIAGFTHCATRLRFTLKDDSRADEGKVKAIKGVLGVAHSGGQFQVIIGPEVPKAFAAIKGIMKDAPASEGEVQAEKKKISDLIFDFVSAVFTPVLPAIIGAGLIRSILSLATLLGMDPESSTYLFLNVIGDAPLYFLPMMLAVTASRKLNCNTFLAVAITGALLHPSYAALITDAFNIHFSSVFGIPVTLATYSSSVIPVVLMVFALKYIEAFFERVIPKLVRFFFKPVLTMLVVGLLTFIVLGPIGFITGVGISTALNALSMKAGWLVPTIIGVIFPLMVTTGMHYGIVPFMLQSIAAVGYEQICCPGNLPSNMCQGAASLAVGLRTKNSELKQTALTSGLTALLGVTEPALFSVTLKFKRVLASVMIGGACGGFYAGILGTKCYSFCSPGLLSLVAFIGPDGWGNLIHSVISFVIGCVITFVLVWVWGYKDLPVEELESEMEAAASVPAANGTPAVIVCPMNGEAVALSEVPDPTFAEEILGKGVAVKPSDGKVFSPVDGTVDNVFDTKHAVGLTGDNGVQVLIHVGLDTVAMNGEGFEALVKECQRVKIGDPLLACDLNAIEKAGHPTITSMVITNTDEYTDFQTLNLGAVKAGTPLIEVK